MWKKCSNFEIFFYFTTLCFLKHIPNASSNVFLINTFVLHYFNTLQYAITLNVRLKLIILVLTCYIVFKNGIFVVVLLFDVRHDFLNSYFYVHLFLTAAYQRQMQKMEKRNGIATLAKWSKRETERSCCSVHPNLSLSFTYTHTHTNTHVHTPSYSLISLKKVTHLKRVCHGT